jgi:hypothetical protein
MMRPVCHVAYTGGREAFQPLSFVVNACGLKKFQVEFCPPGAAGDRHAIRISTTRLTAAEGEG